MRSIVVANPNLAVDRTSEQDCLVPGHVHRSRRDVAVGGGKGANVARAVATMGAQSTLVTLAGGPTGHAALELLADEGITTVAVACEGDTRSCLTVLTPGQTTVFNGAGPAITAAEWDSFEEAFGARLDDNTVASCSGSLPPGSPPDAVARLVELAARHCAWLVVDSSRIQLEKAIEAGAALVTPNLAEAEALVDPETSETVDEGGDAIERATAAADDLRRRGARAALVTVGSQGAVLATVDGTTVLPAPQVNIVNPIGAGDCLVAGLLLGSARGDSLERSASVGIAMASASCETFHAGDLIRKRVEALVQPPM